MTRRRRVGLVVLVAVLVAAVPSLRHGLPAALRAAGLHRPYDGPRYVLPGGRAVIVTTSQATLAPGDRPTGVFGSELTAPYYAFLDAGMHVDVASVRGGPIPIDPLSFASIEVFANHVVVDGRLVTGQNQNAGEEVTHRMIAIAGGTAATAPARAALAAPGSRP